MRVIQQRYGQYSYNTQCCYNTPAYVLRTITWHVDCTYASPAACPAGAIGAAGGPAGAVIGAAVGGLAGGAAGGVVGEQRGPGGAVKPSNQLLNHIVFSLSALPVTGLNQGAFCMHVATFVSVDTVRI